MIKAAALLMVFSFAAGSLAQVPHVISLSPEQNELDAPLDLDISVTFDTNMDETTINDSTFIAFGRSTGKHSGIYSYDIPTNTVSFNPDQVFTYGELVTVILTTGIESSSNIPLDKSHIWNFTIESNHADAIYPVDSTYLAGYASYLCSANFNNDGAIDIAVAKNSAANISVFLNRNDGSGKFFSGLDYYSEFSTNCIVSADFNNDGCNDLAAVSEINNRLIILINNCSGIFDSAYSYATGTNPPSLFTADYDGDGDMDIAVANSGSGNITIFTNDGNGIFSETNTYGIGSAPMSLYAADVDGDFDLDLVSSNDVGNLDFSILVNNGDGTFIVDSTYNFGFSSRSLFCGDFDADNDVDFVIANNYSGEPNDSISILINNGAGVFSLNQTLPAGEGVTGSFAGDLDGDNDPDLAVTDDHASGVIHIFKNDGNGFFVADSSYLTSLGPKSIFSADFNGDGSLDLATACDGDDNITILLNRVTPHVYSVWPPVNAINIPIDAEVSVTFSADMDPNTIDDSTFVVSSKYSGFIEGTVAYDGLTKTATFSPDYNYFHGDIITTVLTTGVESSAGVPLDSGFVFSFTIIVNPSEAYFEIDTTYQIGLGLNYCGSAELNNDGALDLAETTRSYALISILLNQNIGNGRFNAPQVYNTNNGTDFLAAADFNKDGYEDLAAVNLYIDSVTILFNNGSGGYDSLIAYGVGNSPVSLSPGDLDADGDIDFAVTVSGTNTVSVFINNGSGEFMKADYSIGTPPMSVHAADLDNDNDLDLAVSNNLPSANITIILNDGLANFAIDSTYNFDFQSKSIYAADFNADGYLDLAAARNYVAIPSDSVSILINDGSANFYLDQSYHIGENIRMIYAADCDGDGDIDVAAADDFGSEGNVNVILNSGDGTFGTYITFLTGLGPESIFAADFDSDGDLDIVNACNGDGDIVVLLNRIVPHVDSVAPLQNANNVPKSSDIRAYFNTDMDAATVDDNSFIVFSNINGTLQGDITYDSLNRMALFDPDNNFGSGAVITVSLTTDIKSLDGYNLDSSYAWSFTAEASNSSGNLDSILFTPVGSQPFSIFAGDLNNDGWVDLAIANSDSNSVTVLLYDDSTGTYRDTSNYAVGDTPMSIYGADLDGDLDLDLTVANAASATVTILYNNGDGSFSYTRETYDTGGSSWGIFSADLDGDGDLDIMAANGDSGTVSLLFNYGNGTFAEHVDISIGNLPSNIIAGDFDNDGDFDIAVSNSGSDSMAVLLNAGGGNFPSPFGSYDTGGSSWGVFGGDFSGDGFTDIAIAHPDNGTAAILLNDGFGAFPSLDGSYDTGGSSWGIFGGDFDGDGDVDVVASNSDSGTVGILFNEGGGNLFEPVVTYSTAGNAWGIIVADMDNDGSMDVAVTNTNPDGITVLLNEAVVGCSYVNGDVNGSDSYNGLDITYGVNYLKGGSDPFCTFGSCPNPPCDSFFYCGDVNGSCSYNGLDITYGVNYLKGGSGPVPCPSCPPF